MITDLVARPRKKTEIYYNGQYFGSLSKDAVYMARLHIGKQIRKDELVKLIDEYEKNDAVSDLLAVLAKTNLTERQAQQKLLSKNYQEQTVTCAIDKLKEYGYINDTEYANNYIEQNINRYGKLRIKEVLKQKLVDICLIDDLLDDIDETDSCKRVLFDMLKSKRTDIEDYKEQTRIIRAMLYKGFEYETVKDALSEYKRKNE